MVVSRSPQAAEQVPARLEEEEVCEEERPASAEEPREEVSPQSQDSYSRRISPYSLLSAEALLPIRVGHRRPGSSSSTTIR